MGSIGLIEHSEQTMTMQTLAELQALADAEDNPQAVATAEESQKAEPELEQEESTEEELESNDDDESEDDKSSDEKPDWAKEPDTKNFVPARVHSDLRKSLRATQSDAELAKTENEQLKARLAALEGGQATAKPSLLEIPTPENCGFDDDLLAKRTAEYSEAVVERRFRKQAAEAQQEQQNAQIVSQVDKHYERANELIGKGSVTEESFKNADLLVRKAVAETAKGDPDYITDFMIANLGEGSEKVMYHLGVNPKALGELKEAFRSDPTGIRAASFLGELKGKFNSAPPAKLSNAPKPDKVLSGTAKVTSDSAYKAYVKAEKAGDISGMLAAERAAKAKGINISNWQE